MSTDRITGISTLVLGIVLYSLAGDSDAYLFPRLIAIAIALLGIAVAGSTFTGALRSIGSAAGASRAWLKILPALAVLIAYRWAMEMIGFYAAAFVAFLTIVSIYAPEPFSYRTATKRIAISAAFVAVIFAVFSLLLRVQTPRGLLL